MEAANDSRLVGNWFARRLGVWVGRLAGGSRRRERPKPRLALVERVSLAPRQSLALVEAEGRKFLVATSHDSGTTFYALGESPRQAAPRAQRVSW
jgi:flagellar biogenesis protein FliO